MPSTPNGAIASSSLHHVNQNGHPPASSNSEMTSNTNGYYHAVSPSGAVSSMDKAKHAPTSPHKLMIGVPPASTPTIKQPFTPTNGFATEHVDQHSRNAYPSNGLANVNTISDVKGKQKQVDPIDNTPLSQLEQELPLEETDLVSLAALVERIANYGYESLQNLAETLPSLPSSSKRAKIFNTALDVRKQFIKLLVLSRWSKDVTDLQKARNIIALLSEQQWQHEDVFAGLTDIRKILPNARMRNADLPTAIDVLQTGTYRRLPASIKDMAVAPKPFTDEQALAIVSRLEDTLRTRMACRELVPAPLSDYSIRDGKVHFHVDGLFGAQLTASSGGQDDAADAHVQSSLQGVDAASTAASADDRWWLLDLSFDVTPTGSCAASSRQMFPKKPKKAFRERLRTWGDQELAPRSQAQEANQVKPDGAEPTADAASAAVEAEGTEEPSNAEAQAVTDPADDAAQAEVEQIKVSKARDVPLVRLFSFLQERSLHYQMDILQHQAYELCRLNWGTNLRIETGERPRRLTVHYWTHAQGAADATQKADSPAAGGSIQITIVDLADQTGASKTLAKLFDGADEDAGQAGLATVKRRGLQVVWNAHPIIVADSETSDLAVSPHSLDIEALLSLVIRRHTLALLRNLQRRILVSDHPVSRLLHPEDCTLCVEHVQRQGDEFSTTTETTSFNFLQIQLGGSHRQRGTNRSASRTMAPLRLSVDPVTGRLILDSEPARVSQDAGPNASAQQAASFTASILTTRATLARLAEASDRINSSIEALFDILYKLQVFARVEEWERMASYLGLRTVRKFNLRPQDLAKFGPSATQESAPQLFIPLRNSFPGYFLALQPSETEGASIALVYVLQMVDQTGAPSLTVQSIEWLDRAKIATAAKAEREALVTDPSLATEIGHKRKASSDGPDSLAQVDPSLGKRELSMDELANVHSYCIALVSYFHVEQQLRMRGIPYLHVGGNTKSRSAPPVKVQRRALQDRVGAQKDERDEGLFDEEDAAENGEPELHEQAHSSGVASLVPTLCLRATDVLGPAKAHLAKPNISVRVCNWDDSDRCCVEMHLKLRMKSRRFRALHEVVAYASTSDSFVTSPATWIDFDDETSMLTLSTRDLDNCIPIFYTQWERVMRMVLLTREVLNASRAWQQRALRSRVSCKKPGDLIELRRFDFDSVVLSYGTTKADDVERKLLVRVRWQDAKMDMTPYVQSGGYILEFGSVATVDVEKLDKGGELFDEAHSKYNPHKTMAFELARTVNVAARTAALSSMAEPGLERMVWKGFFKLLRDTLGLVREIAPLADKCLEDAEVPEVEIKSATWIRLRFQTRYALDLRLASKSRLIVSDASQSLFRGSAEIKSQGEERIFDGNPLLNSLIAGQVGAEGKRNKSATTTTSADAAATAQFQRIANFEQLVRQLGGSSDGGGGGGVCWDLGRALLISLNGNSGAEVGQVLNKLIEQVSAQIQH